MQSLAGVATSSSEQHKDLYESTIKRDCMDTQVLINYLSESSPFDGNGTVLRSISTGMTASSLSNVDKAKEVGQRILNSMIAVAVDVYVFRKKDQAILMTEKNTPGGAIRQLDPSLLFQRFVLIASKTDMNEADIFQYELCAHPASLFEDSGLLRAPDKTELSKTIAKLYNIDCCPSPSPLQSVPGTATILVFLYFI